jgi:tetratricopeptide (TPR) repeat protein
LDHWRRKFGLILLSVAAGVVVGCGPAPETHPGAAVLRDARAAYEAGRDAEAIDRAETFLLLVGDAPESAEALYLRALARLRQGERDQAEQDLRLAAERTWRADLAGRAHLALSRIAEQRGDPDAALASAEAAVDRLDPAAPPADEALYRLGRLRQRAGRFAQADLPLDRLLHLHPDSPLAPLARRRIRAVAWAVAAGGFPGDDPRQQLRLRQLRRRAEGLQLPTRVEPVRRRGQPRLQLLVGRFETHQAAAERLDDIRASLGAGRVVLLH